MAKRALPLAFTKHKKHPDKETAGEDRGEPRMMEEAEGRGPKKGKRGAPGVMILMLGGPPKKG